MKLIPAGLTFEQALARGYVGRIEAPAYLTWIRTLRCDSCGAPPPSEASHLDNHNKGHGTKTPDLWAIPECHRCHMEYERKGRVVASTSERQARAALYMLRAFYEGRLVWRRGND